MKLMPALFAPLCLLAFQQPLHAEDPPPADQLVVIDLRPSNEKEGAALVPLSGKCNKNVYRIPDVASDPLKVDALKADLLESLGITGDGKTLTVLDWSIYYNKQVSGGGLNLSNVGIQGYSVPGKSKEKQPGSKCSRTESAGGWYQGAEATTLYFPLISEFSGTFGGKPLGVRVVYSPRVKLPGKFQGEKPDTEALMGAVHATAEALVTAMGR